MPPEYFHERLTYGEADDYLGGLNRRYRHGYAQARMVQSIIGQLFAKDYKVQVFPWEEAEVRPPTEEEIKELEAQARAFERRLNQKQEA